MMGLLHGLFSVFAGDLAWRRQTLTTFMEEPCTSTTKINEPYSPTFKGVQTGTRCQSIKQSSLTVAFHSVLMMYVNVSIKILDCVKAKGFQVISSGHPHRLKWVTFPTRISWTLHPFTESKVTSENNPSLSPLLFLVFATFATLVRGEVPFVQFLYNVTLYYVHLNIWGAFSQLSACYEYSLRTLYAMNIQNTCYWPQHSVFDTNIEEHFLNFRLAVKHFHTDNWNIRFFKIGIINENNCNFFFIRSECFIDG